MRYQASVLDRVVAGVIAIRALYAISYIVLVIAALMGVVDMRALNPSLAQFFATQPAPLFYLWALYAFGYLFAANFLWRGRPTRAMITYMCAFALDIILWTFVYTTRVDPVALPLWGHVMDITITMIDLAAISFLIFVVLVYRKPAGEGVFSPR